MRREKEVARMRFCTVEEEDGSAIAALCHLCGGEIYRGEECWHINGETVCPACLEDYARQVFAPFCCRGGEER